MNSVKLYSNGSAVISKGVELNGQPVKLSIPVKKDDLDDVVSSISVFGDVSMPEPPSYTPANSQQTTLKIDANKVLRDLSTKLRGSQVAITRNNGTTNSGKIYGIQTYQRETNGSVFECFRVLLGTDAGVVQYDEADIQLLKFTDPAVQAEIDKSLQASFQEIKPDSRFVDLTLVPTKEGNSTASVSYATPVAAWKIRYQLRFINEVASLEGQVVVDNDTDDDWNNVNLSVITGEPISFSTDIAEIRRPARSRVNVVSDTTLGAVGAAETIRPAPAGAPMAKRMMSAPSAAVCSFNADADSGLESYGGNMPSIPSLVMPCLDLSVNNLSIQSAASSKESGDFSIWNSENPVTILSKKSAIIGLFSLPLEDAHTVLLYKGGTENKRPYRAVKFKNTTPNSLGKGVCEVYVDGDRQGKCVLNATKQGEESLLVHALETGVKVFQTVSSPESKCISIRIRDGVSVSEYVTTRETTYRIDNLKAEKFSFDIEYDRIYSGSTILASVTNNQCTVAETAKGQRISTELPANGVLEVTVTEQLIQSQQMNVNGYWIQNSIISVKHPLMKNKSIAKVTELQIKLDAIQQEFNEAEQAVEDNEAEQERLLKLIPAVHQEQANHYKNDLDASEKAIRELKKTTLPDLRKKLTLAEEEIRTALLAIKADWGDDSTTLLAVAEAK
jgi:hypothetical protein